MGKVEEQFLGLVHVGDTTTLSLRSEIISLLVEHSLSPSKIRGQGYDGANNMTGEINGLKALIMEDAPNVGIRLTKTKFAQRKINWSNRITEYPNGSMHAT
ncbi:hypothetical protein OROGR_027810 [Orobanche gracilis]